MCTSCFNNEIWEFATQDEFKKFDLELTKKIKPLSKSGLKYLGGFVFAVEMGYGKYLCQDCNTEWWYSEPDYVWRGFFVRKENGKQIVAKYQHGSKKKTYGCIFIMIVIIGIIWFLLT